MLRLLDRLSLPGDPVKPNEDAFAVAEDAAAVFDGATMLGDGLMPGPSDAAWIAQFGARRLMAHLKDAAPRQALKAALADTEKSFAGLRRHAPKAQWQVPCASMILVAPSALRSAGAATGTSPAGVLRTRRGVGSEIALEFLWLGDCGAIVAQGGEVLVVGETMDKRAAESARAARLAKEKQVSPAHALSRQAFLAPLRAARDRVNSGDAWLFTPDRRAAAHAQRRIVKAGAGARLLLASDGFLALASDYGAHDAAGLIEAAASRGLAALGAELRAIEDGDAGGDRFARFKKSDDATALLIEVTAS